MCRWEGEIENRCKKCLLNYILIQTSISNDYYYGCKTLLVRILYFDEVSSAMIFIAFFCYSKKEIENEQTSSWLKVHSLLSKKQNCLKHSKKTFSHYIFLKQGNYYIHSCIYISLSRRPYQDPVSKSLKRMKSVTEVMV